MPERISEVMTTDPVEMMNDTSLVDAAEVMRDRDIGDVLVMKPDGTLCGVVTDRDIVVRGIAGGGSPGAMTLEEVCSHEVVTLDSDDSISTAVKAMEEHAIRRLPVMAEGKVVGIVSIGDLAEMRDPDSALAEISSSPANN